MATTTARPTERPASEALAALAESLDVAAEVQDRQDDADGVETVCNKARFMRRLAAEIRKAATVSGAAGGRGA